MIDLSALRPVPAAELTAPDGGLPLERGVYFIFFDSGQLLLERSGYLEFGDDFPFSKDGFDLLYVGATMSHLRRRVLDHLTGNSRSSSLRMTVGALLTLELGLDPVGDGSRTYFHFGDGERRLTNWLVANTRIACVPSVDPFHEEKQILANAPLPFNISERKRHPYSKYLMTLRSYFAGRPNAAARFVDLVASGAPLTEEKRQSLADAVTMIANVRDQGGMLERLG
jgi:hypothetical protein